ncbi:MAG: hypothetical protein ACOH1T_02115 [Microbacteriaceae bacterium]
MRNWMDRDSAGDVFQVSVTCFLRDADTAAVLLERGFERRGRSSDPIALSLATVRFAARTGGDRQARFETALDTLYTELKNAGVDEEFVINHDASLKVYTSLTPITGMADVFLHPATLAMWSPLRTSFHFDMIGR